MRLLQRVDQGLYRARYAVVVISAAFLRVAWPRKELDGLAIRRRVVGLLHGVAERDVAEHSPTLAVAAVPGGMVEHLVNLIRAEPADPDDLSAGTNDRYPRR